MSEDEKKKEKAALEGAPSTLTGPVFIPPKPAPAANQDIPRLKRMIDSLREQVKNTYGNP